MKYYYAKNDPKKTVQRVTLDLSMLIVNENMLNSCLLKKKLCVLTFKIMLNRQFSDVKIMFA